MPTFLGSEISMSTKERTTSVLQDGFRIPAQGEKTKNGQTGFLLKTIERNTWT
jgi:hypothetical protein